MPTSSPQPHTWKFYRIGGLDQVAFETKEDLLNLPELDQKLWVALSCPVKGLEIDEKTLALIDMDGDGRIRVPELLDAVKWLTPRLKDVSLILRPGEDLELSEIDDATPEGKAILGSAHRVLQAIGKAGATKVCLSDVSDLSKIFAGSKFNGDGVIPPDSAEDSATTAVLKDILTTQGGEKDKGGELGVTEAKAAQFFKDLEAYVAWAGAGADKSVLVLGEQTAAASSAIEAVRAKIDDYFTRCRLAAYDNRALAGLNRSEADYVTLGAKELSLTAAECAAFPLAKVEASAELSLTTGLNPAWAGAIATLRETALTPMLGKDQETLSEAQWREITSKFEPFLTWQKSKAGASVEPLGLARCQEILSSKAAEAITALVVADKAVAAEFECVVTVERLIRYRRDLRTLLCNFVNFFDFYSRDRYAVFQAGTLFLDSRSTELCVRVDGPSTLAAMSKAYIAYCACTRPGGEKINIAACFTQGDGDFLFVGRHGVFYDRQGRDWDAVITQIIDNPISIPQAFWSPYKKFTRMIEEQIAKRAASAEAANAGKLSETAETAVNADKNKPAPPKKFDLALITGIGVALGSIGGFMAAVFAKILELKAWQFPLLIIGFMLLISLPSMVIAWIKLRQRSLGPLLEGNGWAVNGRVMINIPFGSALTEKATLPLSARRSLVDPYEDTAAKKARTLTVLLVLLGLAAYAAAAYHWSLWPLTKAEPVAEKTPVAEPATPPAPAPAKP